MNFLVAVLLVPLLYAAYALYAVARTVHAVRRFPECQHNDDDLPQLSVIVPACNEADTIEAALRTKLKAHYPKLELIVVNDRSTDETGAIAERVAAEDPRLKVVHVTELPAGWLGKLNALECGRAAATGEIILFSDADVNFGPELLRRSVSALMAQKLDFITVIAEMTSQSFLLDSSLTTFLRGLLLGGRIWNMRDPSSPIGVGAGVFNLVRRSALEKTPGFEWIKMEVADDIAFGQMMKKSGARCAVYNGAYDLHLAYYSSFPEFVRGLEKNSYAGSSYRPSLALLMLFILAYGELTAAALLPFASGVAMWMAAASLVLVAISQALVVSWVRRPMLTAVLPALGPLLVIFIAARAVLLIHLRGGISWRGTFYSLAQLRAGMRLERL